MPTILYVVNPLQERTSALDLLRQLDLAEWEADYHLSQVEYHTRETEYHLEAHDQALARRNQLQTCMLAPVLAEAVP